MTNKLDQAKEEQQMLRDNHAFFWALRDLVRKGYVDISVTPEGLKCKVTEKGRTHVEELQRRG